MNFPIGKLMPPSDPVTAWRWAVFVAILILMINAALGRGVFGVGQYALASDLAAQGDQIDQVLTLQIWETLRDLKKDECAENGDSDAIAKAIEQLQQKYIKLTGERYPLSDCKT